MFNYPRHHIVNIGLGDQSHSYGSLNVLPTHVTDETYIPRILVDIGAVRSTSEVRRNRKDLVEDVVGTGFQRIEIGKQIVDIFHRMDK
ncbi:hypothetical protein BH753_gp071 [Bacillus phage Shbh1]|uniref:Uncharacterized protein n=1 Tax=Bacillus phage Shbh1 TaxID=1796992 RepID=A0A142F196_9CAUD|nr:hypothetical protein BH753_gp071 [Bacillus phage Shbh1]AMQ66553.1 hypothetical protein [Bacillus phage Shbh1]